MIAFRADGNSKIGMGHVMRCLSIADSFAKNGEQICFLLSDAGVAGLIESRGYLAIVLETLYYDLNAELPKLCDFIEKESVDTLFVDSYFVTERYLEKLSDTCHKKTGKLIYLDDVLAFPYICDVLINYNIYASMDDYKVLYNEDNCPRICLGTEYAPLRTEFEDLPKRNVKKDAKDILVSTGGADNEHVALEMIKALERHSEYNAFAFHFLIGTMNADEDEIKKVVAKCSNVFLHENVANMVSLMRSCDVAISAAGSTLYELCATQTPTITYILADNQIRAAEEFNSKGIFANAGDIREIGLTELTEKTLKQAVKLLDNYNERYAIAERMKMVVDGKGAERIAKEIMKCY